MLQLNAPLSEHESAVLIQSLSELESRLLQRQTPQDFLKRSTLASAKEKVQSNIFDSFYREEITNMVYALDSLSRNCSEKLSSAQSSDEAIYIGSTLCAAAATRAKLRRAVNAANAK